MANESNNGRSVVVEGDGRERGGHAVVGQTRDGRTLVSHEDHGTRAVASDKSKAAVHGGLRDAHVSGGGKAGAK